MAKAHALHCAIPFKPSYVLSCRTPTEKEKKKKKKRKEEEKEEGRPARPAISPSSASYHPQARCCCLRDWRACYFIAHGAPVLGIVTFLAAKVVGTALVAHVFSLTSHNCSRLAARLYWRITAFRDRVFTGARAHPLPRVRARLLALRAPAGQVRRGMAYHLRRRWQ